MRGGKTKSGRSEDNALTQRSGSRFTLQKRRENERKRVHMHKDSQEKKEVNIASLRVREYRIDADDWTLYSAQ
jgi:hypothetical protein